jgi:putative DNA primase/helicase
VIDLMWSMPNEFDYGEYIDVLRAIKTSLGPDREKYFPEVLKWARTYPDNTEKSVRATWAAYVVQKDFGAPTPSELNRLRLLSPEDVRTPAVIVDLALMRHNDPKIYGEVADFFDNITGTIDRAELDRLTTAALQELEPRKQTTQSDALVSQSDKGKLPSSLVTIRGDEIEMQGVEWLWQDRFALGKLGLIAGLPDEGKGQILCDMAACVTNGSEWPCGEGVAPQGNVILLTAEDDLGDTVVPRLAAAGADRSRVHIVSMVRNDGADRMFSLITDIDALRRKITEIGNVKLVQIDPITAYLGLGQIDSFRTTDVRAVLNPLVELASACHVSIVGIMHFNKKVDVTNALLRISDSLAFGATARHVFAVVDDDENKRKLLVRGKNNLARKNIQSLAYGIGVREVGFDQRLNKPIMAPHVVWLGHVDINATQAMQAVNDRKSPSILDDGRKFLADLLANGAVPQQDVESAAKAEMISTATLRRAKQKLGVLSRQVGSGTGRQWTWELPPEEKWDGDEVGDRDRK